MGQIGGPANPEPQWPKDAVERGFAVVPRPTLPLTYDHDEPLLEEIDQPLVITTAPGQCASGVLFIKALKDFPGPFVVGPKNMPDVLLSPPFVEFRVCHPLRINKNRRQWEMRPHYLMAGTRSEAARPSTRSVEVAVPQGAGRSVWVTVFAPNGTPPGDYSGEINVVAPGKATPGPTTRLGRTTATRSPSPSVSATSCCWSRTRPSACTGTLRGLTN